VSQALLLLHAFPVDARMWMPQLDAFGERLRVLAPNHPGFGGDQPVPPVMTMELAAGAALRALDDRGVERAVVCGLSMGGYVAFELWRRAPERISGLVLANTRAGADSEEGAANRRALADRLLSEGTGFFAEGPPGLLSSNATDEVRRRVRELIADQPAEAIAAASLGMAERPDSGPDLPGIAVPTLVVTSTDDTLIPRDVSAEMADLVPGARLAVIEGAGHLSNLERPQEFNRVLGEHLEGVGVL
jgi:3-oxoadipate enol-lactonase